MLLDCVGVAIDGEGEDTGKARFERSGDGMLVGSRGSSVVE